MKKSRILAEMHETARARMSQAVFAALPNTSVATVQKWEIGETCPSGPSLKLLEVTDRKGIEALV